MDDYDAWKKRVDEKMLELAGLDGDSIEDWRYKRDHEEGYTPTQTAKRALKNAGCPPSLLRKKK